MSWWHVRGGRCQDFKSWSWAWLIDSHVLAFPVQSFTGANRQIVSLMVISTVVS